VPASAAYPPSPVASPLAGNEPSIAAHGNIHQALLNAGATPSEADTLTAISGAESAFGRNPISGQNSNGSRDYGYFQINNAAHPQMGGAAVASMPLDQQAQLALQIARSKEGFGAWTTYKNGAYQKYLGTTGAAAAPPVSGVARSPVTPAPAPGASVGSLLSALSAPTGSSGTGPSALDSASKLLQQQQPQNRDTTSGSSPLAATMQAAAMGRANQQNPAAAQQLYAQILAKSREPLSWGAAPPGANAGPQVPGTTLTSGGQVG
jgi:hypothetical protein